jgi:PASTA domain
MASIFSVTAASNSIPVQGNRGETAFTVTNVTAKVLQCRFDLDADKPGTTQWLHVDRPQRTIPPSGAEQVTVKLDAPPGATGSYSFRIIAVSLARPDEDFTLGPSITFSLAQQEIPRPATGGTPWWLFLIAGLLLLGMIGGIVALVSGPARVPRLTGLSSTDAAQVVAKQGLKIGNKSSRQAAEPVGTVVAQTPEAGAKIPDDKTISIVVAGAGFIGVPRVVGLSVNDAAAKLRGAGLVVGSITPKTAGSTASVAVQNPREGVEVVSGSKIDLTVVP